MVTVAKRFPTRTFFQIIPTLGDFDTYRFEFGNTDIKNLSPDDLNDLYLLIASRYGDSHVRYTNEKLFLMALFREINCRYPRVFAWERDQKRLRDALTSEFQTAGNIVHNVGSDNTQNKTNAEIGTVKLDAQTVTNQSTGELNVLISRIESYRSGEEDRFLNELAFLFLHIIRPMADLLFISEEGDE